MNRLADNGSSASGRKKDGIKHDSLVGILIAANAFGKDASSQENGRRHQGPPPEAYCACEGKNVGDMAESVSPCGDTVTGTCELERDGDRLVLRPDNPPERNFRGRPMRNDRD
ncbi:MAG: hypothetical protein KAH06_00950 [Desulfobacterales bacterium]|nr:hypothetical protein [Desulfobacterales bacterium]